MTKPLDMPNDFAARLRSMRCYLGISQDEMADKLGISRKTLSKWENDQRQWTDSDLRDALDRYTRVTNFPLAYFLVPDLQAAFSPGADGRAEAIDAVREVLANLERGLEVRFGRP